MSLLKLFRRCVCPVCDTETTKKITKISTESLVANYGPIFKPIDVLNSQFAAMDDAMMSALAVLLAENDTRGQSGYALTEMFFAWFEKTLGSRFEIRGPRRAGRDIELSALFKEYSGSYPCDFVITGKKTPMPVAIGFARYDSTRGGSQSDDRTGGNEAKVLKAKELCAKTKHRFRIVFLADGPGLVHRDTWEEACQLDGAWNDNVRVTTLKLASERITASWLGG